jgi:hypothetical protein
MDLPNHMQRAGTRLSDEAPKWYRGAFRDAKGNAEEKSEGTSGAMVRTNLKETLA